MPDRLDPTFVRAQIELLRHTHPGIWDEGDEKLLADMLEAETGLNEFLTKLVRQMNNAKAMGTGLDAELVDTRDRRDRYWDRYHGMRELAHKLMAQAGVRKVELLKATLSIRAGTPHVIVTDETRLPQHCVRIKREPDRIAIKAALANGEPVPGAEMSNAEPVLNVRDK